MKCNIQMLWLVILVLPSLYGSHEALKKQREDILRKELKNTSNSITVKNRIAELAMESNNWQLATEALNEGADPCYIASCLPSHMPLFAQAVKQCSDMKRLQEIALRSRCSAQCIQALYDNGVNVTTSGGENGETPLHRAAYDGDIPKVEKLITYNADVLKKDNQGKTPVDYAMGPMKDVSYWSVYEKNQQNLVQMLVALQRGTSMNLLDPEQYPFYKSYRQMILSPSNETSQHGVYEAYGRLVLYLKRAEQERLQQLASTVNWREIKCPFD